MTALKPGLPHPNSGSARSGRMQAAMTDARVAVAGRNDHTLRLLKSPAQTLVWVLMIAGCLIGAVGKAEEAQQAVTHAPLAALQSSEDGKARFEAVCSACHGIQGRGGRGGAPDLLVSPLVNGDQPHFREFVRAGSPAGMPAFPFDEQTLNALQAHLQSLASEARRRGTREIAIVGNAQRGRSFFEGPGGCQACHSVTGDLRHIGTRYNASILQGRIALPIGNGVPPGLLALGLHIPGVTDAQPVHDLPLTVTVTDDRGLHVSGELLSISDFDVTLRDASGDYHSFARHRSTPRVMVTDPAQAHLDRLTNLSDQDLHDLTAYLSGIK